MEFLLDNIKKLHFVGIGGSGMSAIAKVMLKLGYTVSGSDVNKSETTNKLKQDGVEIFIGHAAENIAGAEIIVVSSAIDKSNPEILAAQKKEVQVIHRSDVLAYLMNKYEGIAVAGAHGKTTITSMIALVFLKAELDPTILIGGELDYIGGNSKLGQGKFLIAEADESDASFLKLSPRISVIANIEDDHMDYYGDIKAILKAFEDFLSKLPKEDGLAVVCFDDSHIRDIVKKCDRKYISYAVESPAEYTATNILTNGQHTAYDVLHQNKKLGTVKLSIPGKHNVANSLAAVVVGLTAGLDFKTIADALVDFQGAKRRFQTKGRVNGIWIVDDYAHHPTEISATLAGARQTQPERLICVFQPHRYSRTKFLRKEFGNAFTAADLVILTDVYAAGEQPIAGISGKVIKEEVEKQTGQEVTYIPDKDEVAGYLTEIVRPGDLVMTMGAGNIFLAGEELTEILMRKS